MCGEQPLLCATDASSGFASVRNALSALGAALAQSVELDSVSPRPVSRALEHALVQLFVHRQGQVYDGTAILADKVIMGIRSGFEPIEGASEVNLADQPLFLEDSQVSVHRSHAQGGEVFLQPVIDPIRRRMGTRFAKQLQDTVPLPAPFVATLFVYAVPL